MPSVRLFSGLRVPASFVSPALSISLAPASFTFSGSSDSLFCSSFRLAGVLFVIFFVISRRVGILVARICRASLPRDLVEPLSRWRSRSGAWSVASVFIFVRRGTTSVSRAFNLCGAGTFPGHIFRGGLLNFWLSRAYFSSSRTLVAFPPFSHANVTPTGKVV